MFGFLLSALALGVKLVTSWQTYAGLLLGSGFPALVKKGLAWLGYEVKKIAPKV